VYEIFALLISLVLTVISGRIVIPLLRRLKVGQPILKYVKEHSSKSGTPTMGGLFFIIPSVLVFVVFGGLYGKLALICACVGLSFTLVGFLDDFIKIRRAQNEGLKAYQKIIFQIALGVLVGVIAWYNGATYFRLPFSVSGVDLGVATIPFVAFILIAFTNSVNLTDGLDGLSSSVSVVYLFFCSALILLQSSAYPLTLQAEYDKILLLNVCVMGGILGFLLFNVSKAKVFMGDTGSLGLGGFLSAVSIFSSNALFVPILGIMFVLSSISVIVQVVHFKRTKRRILLMSPLHHHFQLKGYTETQITYAYSLISVVAGLICIIPYV